MSKKKLRKLRFTNFDVIVETLKIKLTFMQLTGCVTLGFSIYALVDGKTISRLVEEGASELGESISVDIYKTSAIGKKKGVKWDLFKMIIYHIFFPLVLVIASSVVIVISFLGCCGAWKENRVLLFLYFVTLLLIFLAVNIGATIAAFQSVDVIKEPLLKSMDKYDPNSQVPENLDITRAWDDVQREVSKLRKNHWYILPTSLFSSRVAVSIISPIG